MGRTACGSCPTIGNRGNRVVMTSPVRYLLILRAGARPVRTAASRARQPSEHRVAGVYGRRGTAPGDKGPRPDGGSPAPLGAVAAGYASMGWPVCLGAHTYRGTRASMERGRACSCDRVGCPDPGSHPVSPAWQMQATVDLKVIQDWWETRPEANVILVTGRVFDVLDVPAAAGARARAAGGGRGGGRAGRRARPGPDAVLRGHPGLAR